MFANKAWGLSTLSACWEANGQPEELHRLRGICGPAETVGKPRFILVILDSAFWYSKVQLLLSCRAPWNRRDSQPNLPNLKPGQSCFAAFTAASAMALSVFSCTTPWGHQRQREPL